jgi:hypothetical protein
MIKPYVFGLLLRAVSISAIYIYAISKMKKSVPSLIYLQQVADVLRIDLRQLVALNS